MKKMIFSICLLAFLLAACSAFAQENGSSPDDREINHAKLKMAQDKAAGNTVQYKKDKEALKDLRKARRNAKRPANQKPAPAPH